MPNIFSFNSYLTKVLHTAKAIIQNKTDSTTVNPPSLRYFIYDDTSVDGKSVRFKFIDATDKITSNGIILARWAKTIVTKKIGGYPSNPNDGTIVVTNTERNYYTGTNFINDTISSIDLAGGGMYYRAFSVAENGQFSFSESSGFTVTSETNTLDWDKISELIQSGEAQTFGGLQVGSILTTPMNLKDGKTDYPNHPVEFRIVGYDCEDVNYEGNPNGNPLHSMTLWSEHYLFTMQISAKEKSFALTEDTHFHKEFELELLVTSNGTIAKSSATPTNDHYVNFYIVDKTASGYNRIWNSYSGRYRIAYDATNDKWKVYENSTGNAIYSSKSNTLNPFDNRYVSDDTVDITDTDDMLWEKHNNDFIILNAIKEYYITLDDVNFEIDDTITDGGEIEANSYYEINPDLNGPRANTSYKRNTETAMAHRSANGNNRYKGSFIQQYLNSNAEASLEDNVSNWFIKPNIWSNFDDDGNHQYYKLAGFLSNFTDQKFLNHLATVKHFVERNYVCDGGGYDVIYEKLSLPSRSNLDITLSAGANYGHNGTNLNSTYHHNVDGSYEIASNNNEGKLFDYIQQKFNDNDDGSGTYLKAIRKRSKFSSVTSFSGAWLRSPSVGGSFYVWIVGTSGALSYNLASYAGGVAPLLTLI